MPVYDKVSIDDLHDLLKNIESDLTVAVTGNLHALVAYCIVMLYEYCVCMAYMRINNVTTMENAKANVNTMKSSMVDSGEAIRSLLNIFRNTRDTLCHIATQVNRRTSVCNLLSAKIFYTTLEYFNVPSEIIDSLNKYYTINFTNQTQKEFNPWDYIRQKVGDYVSLLPIAAVCDCKTPEDCQDLIDSLAHLL